MELLSGRRLAFAEPYVSPVHVLRSLAATACAGPFMLTNEALAARREGRIGTMALLSCCCTAISLGVGARHRAHRHCIMGHRELRVFRIRWLRRFGAAKCRSMRSIAKRLSSRTSTRAGLRPTPR
ncbi:DUF6949 family protein [Mesorhizobium atlanticum]